MPRYSTVLFDLDHTLLDSNTSAARAYERTMRSAGVDDPDAVRATYEAINDGLWAAVERGEISPEDLRVLRFERFVAATGIDADPVAMADEFVAGLSEEGELFDDAVDVLTELAGTATLAMVTNGIGQVQRARIDRLGLDRFFSAIVISGEVGCSKPGAEIFDLTFARLGRPPRVGALMVGDSLSSDIAGGVAAGIDTCWYAPVDRPVDGAARPTHRVAELVELPSLVSP